MITGEKYLILVCVFLLLFSLCALPALAEPPSGSDIPIGMPFGTEPEADLDLCPMGVNTIGLFLEAWKKGDFKGMYDLIDEKSKEGYPFQQARFDFQMLDFKPYRISSVGKDGDNYEFILSHGDWKDGDKSIRKMIISGTTFKIIMPTSNSPFKRSAEDYI
jgi:hypothetical protein